MSTLRQLLVPAAAVAVCVCAPCALGAGHPKPPLRPFIDPIELHQWWFVLLVPMAFFVAMIYKAVRLQTIERYWWHVCVMTLQIVLGMIGLGAATWFVVFIIARIVAERAG
ncbi:MAG: hypothetical protein KF699_15795 [Phycisphaeraceae bacterium]|nr:hypothetical protein [Phycisphaeraceae bacterium]MBX3406980.1 hypothetical protein [Phycisphaeraceae bacterium]